MKGIYTFGVTSDVELCSFTITVTNHPVPIIELSPGIPQQGSVGVNDLIYYAFYNSMKEDVQISITPSVGSP